MRVTNIVYEDFVNYKKPSMFLGSISCDFKCCVEGGFDISICQNSSLAQAKITDISNYEIYNKYMHNPITQAVVIGGLEPMLQWQEVLDLIYFFRANGCDDDFVIYTGYTEDELEQTILWNFKKFKNIIFKFGRFRMNEPHHYDEVLGVELASPNQYAKRIS